MSSIWFMKCFEEFLEIIYIYIYLHESVMSSVHWVFKGLISFRKVRPIDLVWSQKIAQVYIIRKWQRLIVKPSA